MNRVDHMATMSLEAINNVVKHNIVPVDNLNYSEDSFLIKKTRELVFNKGQNYIPPLNTFRASRLPHPCVKLQQLEKITPDSGTGFSNRQQGTFAVGNAVHEYEQKKLQQEKSLILASELNVSTNFKDITITGHIDLVVLHPELGIMVTDIKTMSGKAFHWLDTYGVSGQYQLQANIYSNIIKSENYSIKCDNKESFDMREYFFKKSDPLFKAMQEKAQLIYTAIINEYLLPRLPEFPDYWTCQYDEKDYRGNKTGNVVKCQFFDVCHKTETWEDIVKLEVE